MTNKREIEPIMITTTKGIRNCTCSNFISYYISCFLQIRSHDRQCCPDCYWNLAWERCSWTIGKMPPIGHVW